LGSEFAHPSGQRGLGLLLDFTRQRLELLFGALDEHTQGAQQSQQMIGKLFFQIGPAALFPPTRKGKSMPIVKGVTPSLGCQALFVVLQGLTMACAAALLLLLLGGNTHRAKSPSVAAHVAIQTERQLVGIAA